MQSDLSIFIIRCLHVGVLYSHVQLKTPLNEDNLSTKTSSESSHRKCYLKNLWIETACE